jgi:hypothetical protein
MFTNWDPILSCALSREKEVV